MVEELVLLLLVLRDQERDWVDDGIPLQDERLDIFVTLEQDHIEQVLRSQLDASRLRWLEPRRDEVDDLLQRQTALNVGYDQGLEDHEQFGESAAVRDRIGQVRLFEQIY